LIADYSNKQTFNDSIDIISGYCFNQSNKY
jgi:hypothetical protein